jgi:hypothetical protein
MKIQAAVPGSAPKILIMPDMVIALLTNLKEQAVTACS